jgi:4-hydroxythreonine-4-phosphate dehydrogenase
MNDAGRSRKRCPPGALPGRRRRCRRSWCGSGLRTTIELVARSLRDDFAIAAPRIGVVGLNPHAGEGGLLGTEERDVIAPALGALPGVQLAGPLVPDAAFRALVEGRHDALIAMYHDQGLIPVKLIDFDEAVNVTLGLPIVRISPDHGTAYDIAGTGMARAISMQRALAVAIEMAARRAETSPTSR